MRLFVRISYDHRLYKKKNWLEHQVANNEHCQTCLIKNVDLRKSQTWSESIQMIKHGGWSQLISQCLEFNCRAVALLATENIWRKEREPNRAPTKWSHSPKSAEHFVHWASHLNLSLLSFSNSSLAPSPLWWDQDFEQFFRCPPS